MPFGPAPDISRAIKDSTDNAKAAATQGIAKSGTYLTRKLANTSSPVSLSTRLFASSPRATSDLECHQ